ncbi:hypothetical protein ABEF91_008803 [Exophiala dermatitidis]
MSSQGSQKLSSSPLCLPLLKFSYATVSNESIAPIPWIHLSSKNSLFAVFETSPVQLENGYVGERQKFKVLRDPEVMEELDLNALSAGAHRAMAQAPNIMSPQIPEVTVIVKVPMIAMKYPMPNGQIRRFQIRFATNEDYYEAMKMLSRADVPTVEAGSFPAQKSQAGARPLPRNLVTPSDSASQIGLPAEPTTLYMNQKPDHAAMGPPRYSTAGFAPQPAPIARPTMAPPNYFPATTDINQRHPQLPPSVAGPWPDKQIPGNQISAARSNISLSTATTLVCAVNRPGPRAPPAYTNNMADAADTVESRVADLPINVTEAKPPQADNAHLRDHQGELGLPPKRELPFRRTEPAKTEKQRSDNKQQPQRDDQPRELDADDSRSVATTAVTGKRKRAATRKTSKPSTAKKPRTTTTRKKTGKAKDDTPPVPSVEELLQKQDSPLQRRNDQLRGVQPPAQKSQTRLIRVSPSAEIPESDACSLRSQTGKCGIRSPSLGGDGNVTKRITRSTSKCLGTAFLELGTHGEKDIHEVQKPGCLPCTPADQIVVPLTPSSPLGGAAVSKESNPLAPPPPPAPLRRRGSTTRSTKSHKPKTSEQADSAESEGMEPKGNRESGRSQTNNSFTCADLVAPPSGSSASAAAAVVTPLERALPAVQKEPTAASDVQEQPAPAPHKNLNHAQALAAYLETDPDPGNEKLQAWSAMPPATGIPLLRSYFCKLIMDPNFSALCKTLGSFWEREILERRIGQMSGVGDDIMMSVSRDRDRDAE